MSDIKLELNGKTYIYDPGEPSAKIRSAGKFNSVYRGYDKENDEAVIIKKLNESLRSNTTSVERFKREFSFNIIHPNIVQTLAYIEHSGDHYIIREYAQGIDLKTLSENKKLKKEHILSYALDILDALQALHEQGIIHCDIRPANVIVDEKTNQAKLTDLGLSKKKNEFTGRSPFALIYSPPEQLLNISELVNESSDLYALGITLYELLTGEIPFYHTNPELLMNLQLTQVLGKNKKIPYALFKIIKKATNKYPFPLPPKYFNHEILVEFLSEAQLKRYQTANEMKEALLKIKKIYLRKLHFGKNFSDQMINKSSSTSPQYQTQQGKQQCCYMFLYKSCGSSFGWYADIPCRHSVCLHTQSNNYHGLKMGMEAHSAHNHCLHQYVNASQ